MRTTVASQNNPYVIQGKWLPFKFSILSMTLRHVFETYIHEKRHIWIEDQFKIPPWPILRLGVPKSYNNRDQGDSSWSHSSYNSQPNLDMWAAIHICAMSWMLILNSGFFRTLIQTPTERNSIHQTNLLFLAR